MVPLDGVPPFYCVKCTVAQLGVYCKLNEGALPSSSHHLCIPIIYVIDKGVKEY